MAALGTFALVDAHARSGKRLAPRLHFSSDGTVAITQFTLSSDEFVDAAFDELQSSRLYYENELSVVKKPTDFTPEVFAALAASANMRQSQILAGLACCVGDKAFQSMRDVLSLVQRGHLRAALFTSWRKSYEVPDSIRTQLKLGARKPTLRLDPADERLYALRFS